VGFQTLTDGGFDSRGMEGFFGRLQSGTRIYESAAPSYLRTHPMTIERISDMQNRTRNLRVKQRADSLDFQLIRARLRVLQETTTQGWRDALEYFNGQVKNQTTASEIAAQYGIAVAALKLNQPDLAVQAAQAARRLSAAPSPVLDKVVAESRLVAARTPEERAAAVKVASDNATRYPLSSLAVSHYLDVLNQTNQHETAIAFLRKQEAISRTQPAYHALLGRSYAALNRRSLQHQSIGEMYALLGAPQAAVNQLELARRANDGDFYTMSEIDARMRDLQAEVKRDRENFKEVSKR
ncbi:MAG TPA: M48 family peptidase, partial [Burkholderiaceae bacterium]|nr:M48 family peptidase [Burkholderiaceae bacterium]